MKASNFILFSDCIPVKGHNRSIICDTRNNKIHLIPNGLYDILDAYNGKTIENVKTDFNHDYDDIIDQYFEYLIENKLIFFNSNPKLFPKISTEWNSPSQVTNFIMDYNGIDHDFKSLMPQFEDLKCSYIQLRFFKKINFDYIREIASLLKDEKSRVASVDFILPFSETICLEELREFLLENSRIHSIIFFNAPYDRSDEPVWPKMGYIMHVKRNILNEKHCGIINEEYFYSNIKLYTESLHHNTCLNRKISIDKDGNIKNCPSMSGFFISTFPLNSKSPPTAWPNSDSRSVASIASVPISGSRFRLGSIFWPPT